MSFLPETLTQIDNAASYRLVFRLSSLGDIVLSRQVLSRLGPGDRIIWVTKKEFRALLPSEDSRITVVGFDKKDGLKGWLSLCTALSRLQIIEVIDLHKTMRTSLARLVFLFCGNRAPWRRVAKDRWRLWGFYLFKRAWPKSLRPVHFMERFFETFQGDAFKVASLPLKIKRVESVSPQKLPEKYVCVMPASRWRGKELPLEKWLELLEGVRTPVMVLGGPEEATSLSVLEGLRAKGLKVLDGVGRFDLRQIEEVIAHSIGFFGVDTGLAHIAQSRGIPTWVFFGPTHSEMGFGPWAEQARAVESSVFCRPCGKDGRYCFRFTNRYKCTKTIDIRPARKGLLEIENETQNLPEPRAGV